MFRFKVPSIRKLIFIFRTKRCEATIEFVKEYVLKFGPFELKKKHKQNLLDRFNYYKVEKNGDCTVINVSCSLCKAYVKIRQKSIYKNSNKVVDCRKCPLGKIGQNGCMRVLDLLVQDINPDSHFEGTPGTEFIYWPIELNELMEKQLEAIHENYHRYIKFV